MISGPYPDVAGEYRLMKGTGSYILELETHDVEEADREQDARYSRELMIGWFEATHS
ncbi:hypothetical protein [Propionibacterium sp. oral taxon 192]|uniref:hypothetical protein n=1 Tax=Propionibacterium sp. oral taxon 192 TaxID=671222 RepID=UPI0018DE0284|nr:hypothetical protein [Propionibacterium sp. oral taxon 192]